MNEKIPITPRLLNLFRNCPREYERYLKGETADVESKARLLGQAAHVLLLRGRDKFDEQYLVGNGPLNPKTGEPFGKQTKAYQAWAESVSDKCILSTHDLQILLDMEASFKRHPFVQRELQTCGLDPLSEVSVQVEGRTCRTHFDFITKDNCLIELKTTANQSRFNKYDLRDAELGYVHELAFKRMVYRALTNFDPTLCYIVAVDKEKDRTAVYYFPHVELDKAEAEVRAALRELTLCEITGTFPTRYETIITKTF